MADFRAPSRTHDRRHFFKFMSVGAALASLSTSSLRYSAPSTFNDPFDHNIGFSFPFSKEEFSAALLEELIRATYDDTVIFQKPTQLSKLCLAMRSARDKVTREQLTAHLTPGVQESAARFAAKQQEFNDTLTAHLSHSRVLCVTEDADNVVMWSHYADQHRGVALRLECIDAADNTLLSARPVRYTDSFLPFPPLAEYMRHLTGERPIDFHKVLYDEAIYLKHKDWAYEREWRVHVPLRPTEPIGDGFSIWREDKRVFGAIYFGCRIENTDAQKLMQVIEARLPHLEVFETKMSRSHFRMEFKRLR